MTLEADNWKNLLGAARVFIAAFERRWKNREIFLGETRACS